MIEEDEEDQEEVEYKGAGSSAGSKKYMMTQETVKSMVTMVPEDMMKKVTIMEEKNWGRSR
eukprot:7082060-Heterocapsa_arctica.AAC.1